MKIALVVLILFVGVIGLLLYRFNKVTHETTEVKYGPFVIKADARTAKTLNMNYGFVDATSVQYSIWHDGKPVSFPGRLQNNTGLPFLWKVYALEGVSEPTLIAGSQSLYLISIRNGEAHVEPLLSQGSDFATLQFLDNEDGQPGKEISVYMNNSTDKMGVLDTLMGGSLLLVGGSIVLELPSMKQWIKTKHIGSVDNYSYPIPKGVISLSPDRKSMAFNGSFQIWNAPLEDFPDSDHAVVVYNYELETAYTVVYDDTETRLLNMESVNRDWFNLHFEWVSEEGKPDVLKLKARNKPENWVGTYKERDNYYNLYPVEVSMVDVLVDFMLQKLDGSREDILKDTSAEYSGRTITLVKDDLKFDIVHRAEDQTISFSKELYVPFAEDEKYRILVKEMAEAFNAELAAGKYQEHFGVIEGEKVKQLRERERDRERESQE